MKDYRPPAFQFYANDWLSSPKITMMTPAQEGAYIRLLAYCWADDECGVGNDMAMLCRLSRIPEIDLRFVIESCFVPHPKNPKKICNKKQIDVKHEMFNHHKRRVGAGLRGSDARWQSDSNAIALPPSSSSSSSSERKKDCVPEVGAEKVPPPPTTETWLTPYFEIWRKVFNADPPKRTFPVLRKLDLEHGAKIVRFHLWRYISQNGYEKTIGPYDANLEKFAATFGKWGPEKTKVVL